MFKSNIRFRFEVDFDKSSHQICEDKQMTTSLVLSWIHTFSLLNTQKQDCSTKDVDDADDP